MKSLLKKIKLPSLISSLLAFFSAILLTLAFPNFEFWYLAYVAFVPLFFSIEREKESFSKSFITGWIFGVTFFTGTCWWLTFAPITYAGVPTILAYLLLLGATSIVGLYPALFGGLFSLILKRFGTWGILSAPFLWTAVEFLRFWTTGNNWNAIAYSQAFNDGAVKYAAFGGIYLVGFVSVWFNTIPTFLYIVGNELRSKHSKKNNRLFLLLVFLFPAIGFSFSGNKGHYPRLLNRFSPSDNFKGKIIISIIIYFVAYLSWGYFTRFENRDSKPFSYSASTYVVVVQPNVPMSSIKYEEWLRLRERHIQLAENSLKRIVPMKTEAFDKLMSSDSGKNLSSEEKKLADERARIHDESEVAKIPKIVIFPESPMNFGWTHDREFQEYLQDFTHKNNVEILFNAAEPSENHNYYNSAVLVNEAGRKIAQYDKIHLVPFGEYVPLPEPLASLMPTMVGNFEIGKEYDIVPLGDVKSGIMICFESHFPTLSRQFVLNGADVLVEMTNDGYLGPTPILRQHLANAVFRAVETNRPVLRVTNVGISGYINERGEVIEPSQPYTEDSRVWSISKSDGSQTFYVKYGDWFAWLCSLVSLGILFLSFRVGRVQRVD